MFNIELFKLASFSLKMKPFSANLIDTIFEIILNYKIVFFEQILEK